jgi:hypothetical protein
MLLGRRPLEDYNAMKYRLDWTTRFLIINGVARGCLPRFEDDGNLANPSNILLDVDLEL